MQGLLLVIFRVKGKKRGFHPGLLWFLEKDPFDGSILKVFKLAAMGPGQRARNSGHEKTKKTEDLSGEKL